MNELSYLYSLQQFGIKLGLSNIKGLCAILDNPQDKIKTVHIGGTNGKGSTAAVLSSVLQKAGYKTGLYTSPHLTDLTERLSVHGCALPHCASGCSRWSLCGRPRSKDIAPTF